MNRHKHDNHYATKRLCLHTQALVFIAAACCLFSSCSSDDSKDNAACESSQIQCGSECLDAQKLHLASCKACAADYCDADNNLMNGCEIYTKGSDAKNCGGCGIKCSNACVNGVCQTSEPETSCQSPNLECDSECLDLQMLHLASCTACAADYCDADDNLMNGCEIYTKSSDVNNCGKCGSVCDGHCVDGECYLCNGTGEIFDENSNRCICDAVNHWSGSVNNCHCKANYTQTSDARCEPCPDYMVYKPETLSCEFETAAPNCEDGQIALLGNCVSEGDFVRFGHYIQSESGSVPEPLEWKILKIEEERVLLITKYVIDGKAFNHEYPLVSDYKKHPSVTWSNSDVRAWLNGLGDNASDNFIKSAFYEIELNRIKQVTNINSVYSKYDYYSGDDTEDSVFLLSFADAEIYFSNQSSRIALPTPYVNKHTDVFISSYDCAPGECAASWWLRNHGDYGKASDVFPDGLINDNVGESMLDIGGIRPALWLSR